MISECRHFSGGTSLAGTPPEIVLAVAHASPLPQHFLPLPLLSSLFHLPRFLSAGPQPADASSAGLVMKDVEVVVGVVVVVVAEVARVFVGQKGGLWGPP